MKTPREILFERHRATEKRLDEIRENVLSDFAKTSETKESRPAYSRFGFQYLVLKLWQEVFWPSRRIWLGLASVWLVILGIHLTQQETPSISIAKAPAPSPEATTTLREQKQLMSQLLEPMVPLPVRRSPAMGPRSEQTLTFVIG